MIEYVTKKCINPRVKGTFYRAAIVSKRALTTAEIIDSIEKRSTMSSADIKGVLEALVYEIQTAMKNGVGVKLDGIGTFRPILSSYLAEKEEEITKDFIRCVRVAYYKSSAMQKALKVNQLSFTKVKEESTLSTPEEA